VLAEAMKPFLECSWRPQVMTSAPKGDPHGHDGDLRSRRRSWRERAIFVTNAAIAQPVRTALESYPIPSPGRAGAGRAHRRGETEAGDAQYRRHLGAGRAKDAPRPVDMRRIFPAARSGVGPLRSEPIAEVGAVAREDPRRGSAHTPLRARSDGVLGRWGRTRARDVFRRPRRSRPTRQTCARTALHYARGKDWPRAVPLLEQVVAESPDRLPALEALAAIRVRQGRIDDAFALRQRIYAQRDPTPAELVELGSMAMDLGQTPIATRAFERARAQQGPAFTHDLEWAFVSADKQFEKAAGRSTACRQESGYPDGAFKRAGGCSLQEPDAASRIALARQRRTPTRDLIARGQGFRVSW
jgi:hypothetical protein